MITTQDRMTAIAHKQLNGIRRLSSKSVNHKMHSLVFPSYNGGPIQRSPGSSNESNWERISRIEGYIRCLTLKNVGKQGAYDELIQTLQRKLKELTN